MSPTISQRTEWDGTFTLLLDGEVILERKAKAEIEAAANYLSALLKVRGLTPDPQ